MSNKLFLSKELKMTFWFDRDNCIAIAVPQAPAPKTKNESPDILVGLLFCRFLYRLRVNGVKVYRLEKEGRKTTLSY